MAADPETGIITDEKLTRAAGTENSDPAVAEEFLAAEAGQLGAGSRHGRTGRRWQPDAAGREPLAWYGDSAYGTGDLRGAIGEAGHQAVIKPKPLQAPVEGGFTVDDFTVDEQAGHGDLPGRAHRRAQPDPRSPPSASPAGTARCARGAPPARPAARSSCTPATTCCAPPARDWAAGPGCARTT